MKTRDKYEIREGMWLSSTDEIIEVGRIFDGEFEAREIIFDEEDPDKFTYGDTRILQSMDLHKFSYK